jgi:hypothetical protein
MSETVIQNIPINGYMIVNFLEINLYQERVATKQIYLFFLKVEL